MTYRLFLTAATLGGLGLVYVVSGLWLVPVMDAGDPHPLSTADVWCVAVPIALAVAAVLVGLAALASIWWDWVTRGADE